MRTIVLKIVTDKRGNLYVDLWVVVFEDLLDNIVSKLIINQLIELPDAYVYKGALDL